MEQHKIIIHQNTDAGGGIEFQERELLPVENGMIGFDGSFLPVMITAANGGIKVVDNKIQLDPLTPLQSEPLDCDADNLWMYDATLSAVKTITIGDLVNGSISAGTGLVKATLPSGELVIACKKADSSQLGVVQIGDNIDDDGDGLISVAIASDTRLGVAKFDSGDFEVDGEGTVTLNIDYLGWKSTPPAGASASGTAGQIAYDNDYFYVCVATDTWKRTSLAKWS